VDLEAVKAELPHGEVSVRAVSGGLRVPDSDALIACAAITVSARFPS
jgi:predicted nucleic acid-binding protein